MDHDDKHDIPLYDHMDVERRASGTQAAMEEVPPYNTYMLNMIVYNIGIHHRWCSY